MQTRTIELHIKRAGEGARGVDPHAFAWEPLTYERELSSGTWVQSELVWNGKLRELLGSLDSPAAAAHVADLLETLLDELRWPVEALRSAARGGPELTLELCFAADELTWLPWELVRIDGTTLAMLPGVHLRYRLSRTALEAPTDHEHGRVLIASAGRVPRKDHEPALHRALVAGGRRAPKRLRDVSLSGLQAGLAAASAGGATSGPVTVLHLLAHGVALADGSLGIALDEPVDARTLAQALGRHRSSLRLVVLCVCRSAAPGQVASHLGSLAQELHEAGIESVLASRRLLSVDGSIVLSETLYTQLAAANPPASLEQAVAAARAALQAAGHHDDALSLTLFSRCRWPSARPLVFRPYRGLSSFRTHHHRFFFGRDAELAELRGELEELIERARPRMQVVEGRSGSGKSSLVRCALAWELESTGRWTTAAFVPHPTPGAGLEAALQSLADAPEDHRQLLIVDQLEEIFTTPSWTADHRSRFAQRLWSLARDPTRLVSVVCTLRTDFRGRCGEVLLETRELGENKLERRFLDRLFVDSRHQVFVPRMSAADLQAAITCPAEAVGLTLEPRLVDEMVAEVGDAHGALPLVQFALDSLWETREGRTLCHAHYTALGGALGALEHQAEQLVARWSAEEQAVARRLFVRLVSTGTRRRRDLRRRLPVAELRPSDAPQAQRFDRVLAALVDAHLLLRTEDRDGQHHVEVMHEALIRSWSRLGRWLEDDHEMVVAMRQLDRWMEEHESGRRDLLDAVQVGFARRVADQFGPDAITPAVGRYLDRSARALEHRRFKRVLIASALAVLIIGTAAIALEQALTAHQAEADTRRSLRLATVQAMLIDASSKPPETVAAMLRATAAKDEIRGWVRAAYTTLGRGGFESATYHPPPGQAVIGWECGVGTAMRRRQTDPRRDAKRRCTSSEAGARFATTRLPPVPAPEQGGGAEEDAASHTVFLRIPFSDEPVRELVGHAGPVTHASFSPDGRQVLTISDDGTARTWAVASGQLLHTFVHEGTGHHTARFSVDGRLALTASSTGPTLVWSTTDGSLVHRLPAEASDADSALFVPGGRLIATSGQHHAVDLWSTASGALVTSLDCTDVCNDHICEEEATPSLSISTSADGRLVAANHHGQAHVWSTHVDELPEPPSPAPLAAGDHEHAGPDADPPGQLPLHDITTGLDHVDFVLLSPDGDHLAIGYSAQAIRVYDISQAEPRLAARYSMLDRYDQRSLRHTELAAFLPDGRTLGVVYEDGTARAWTWAGSSPAIALHHRRETVLNAGFTQHDARILTASTEGTLRVWSLDGEAVDEFAGEPGETYLAAAVSPAGDRAAAVGEDGAVSFWSLADRTHLVRRPEGAAATDTHVAFYNNGQTLLTSSPAGQARVWTPGQTTEPVSLELGDVTVLLAARMSSDARRLVTVDRPHGVRLWDAETGEPADMQPAPIPNAWTALFSEQGDKLLVTTLGDTGPTSWSDVIVLNSADGSVRTELRGHEGMIYSTDIGTQDQVVTSSHDRTARVWSLALDDHPAIHVLPAREGLAMSQATYSPRGDRLLTVEAAGPKRLWNARSGEQELSLADLPGDHSAAAVSIGRDHFLTYGPELPTEVWPLRTDELADLLWAYSPVCLSAAERAAMLGEAPREAEANQSRCTKRVIKLRDEGVYDWLGPFAPTVGRPRPSTRAADRP